MSADPVIVFLGPSLAVQEAHRVLGARYLSPARCGDVLRVRALRPCAVAIIDGLFETTAAVWHKEILLALEDGIAVFGAASMGALRAAELAPFGMVGVGKIFEAYRDGVYTDDDEVAVLHGSSAEGYRPRSEPMVNIRATVAAAVEAGVIRAESGERLLTVAKEIFYQERSLASAIDRTWDVAAGDDEPTRFRRFIANGGYVDQKRLDALVLVHHLAGWRPTPGRPRNGTMRVNRSSFVAKLHRDVMCRPFVAGHGDLATEEKVGLEARVLGSTYRLLRTLAELLSLADGVARELSLAATPRALAHVFEHDDFGLGPEAKTRRWARVHDLDEAARKRFVERLGAINALLETLEDERRRRGARPRGWEACLLALLRIDGRYAHWRPAGLRAGVGVDRAILRHAEAHGGEDFRLYRRIAKLWRVVDAQTRRRGFKPTEDLQVLADEFRRARRLKTAAATRHWLRANDLDSQGFIDLVEADARLSAQRHGSGNYTLGLMETLEPVSWLLDAIRLAGFYPRLKQRLARAPESHGATRQPDGESFARMLRRHCTRLGEPIPTDVEAYARSLDFPDGQADLSVALAALEAEPSSSSSGV